MPRETETQPEWLLLGMRAIYDPQGEPVPTTYELRFGDEVFWAGVDDGSLRVGRGTPSEPDAVLTSDVETVPRLMRGRARRTRS